MFLALFVLLVRPLPIPLMVATAALSRRVGFALREAFRDLQGDTRHLLVPFSVFVFVKLQILGGFCCWCSF